MTDPTTKKRLISGSIWALGGKILTVLAVLAVNALITRLLSPDDVGVYFIIFSIVSMAAIFAQIGLNQIAVRLIAGSLGTGDPARAGKAIRIMLAYLIGASTLVAAILYLGLGEWIGTYVFKSPIISSIVGLLALWLILTAAQALLAEIFRGFHDIVLATVFSGLLYNGLVALLFASVWVIYGHSDIHQVIYLSLAAGLTGTVLAGILLGRRIRELGNVSSLGYGEVLIMTLPLLVTNVMLFMVSQADLWIVGMFRPQEEVALYGAASRLVLMIAVPLLIINAVVPPLIAEMYAQNKKQELEKTLRLVSTIAGIPAFLVLIVFALGAEFLLKIIYGPFYSSAALILIILSLGQLINVWSGSCGLVLMLTGHQNTMMLITLAAGIITIILSLFLVNHYGIVGVAVSSAAGMSMQNIAMLLFAKIQAGIWTHVRIIRPSEIIKFIKARKYA